jgi:hypothetical protein
MFLKANAKQCIHKYIGLYRAGLWWRQNELWAVWIFWRQEVQVISARMHHCKDSRQDGIRDSSAEITGGGGIGWLARGGGAGSRNTSTITQIITFKKNKYKGKTRVH